MSNSVLISILPEWCAEKITTMRQLDTVMAV